jgi:putative hydrolase
MRIAVDTHVHSVASGHAYSTVLENARSARRRGVRGFVLTDHGPGLGGGTHIYHFGNLKVLPALIAGVRVYKGAEANIMDPDGALDIPAEILEKLDFVLAGFHEASLKPGKAETNTAILERVLRNPYVDAVSHPGNPVYPIDVASFVNAVAVSGKLVEINNGSFSVRRGSADRCAEIANECARRGVRIACGSDAHVCFDVGRFDRVIPLLKEIRIAKELVVNASLRSFDQYLAERAERIARAKAAAPALNRIDV